MLQQAIPLGGYTTWKVGGPAEYLAEPDSLTSLLEILAAHKQTGGPLQIIGAGSNLLISDQGLPGLVICTRRLQGAQLDGSSGLVEALAGEPLPTLARRAANAVSVSADYVWSFGLSTGATVTMVDIETDEERTYQIVGEVEADIKSGFLSINSPLARALIGKSEGEEVDFAAPGGHRAYEILKVKFI